MRRSGLPTTKRGISRLRLTDMAMSRPHGRSHVNVPLAIVRY
jgi:hypothetical protein